MTTHHTPTPQIQFEEFELSSETDCTGRLVGPMGEFYGQIALANRSFVTRIQTCVNAHDTLLAELAQVKATLETANLSNRYLEGALKQCRCESKELAAALRECDTALSGIDAASPNVGATECTLDSTVQAIRAALAKVQS